MTRITNSEQVAGIVAYERNGRPIYVLYIVDSWARQVSRMAMEAAAPLGSMPDTRSVDDFVGALCTRDRLKAALEALGGYVDLPSVTAADELYRRFTIPDETKFLLKNHSDARSGPWWWDRIPSAGPIVEDLKEWWGYEPDAPGE